MSTTQPTEQCSCCKNDLDKINDEFHEAIARHGHCYERGEKEAGDTCDCVTFYQKWVDTKQKQTEAKSPGCCKDGACSCT